MLSSWDAIENRVKEYYAFMLMLQTGMLGVFISLDFFMFYVFWEVMLVPMYFLIGVWGGPRKLYAAIKFFLYTLVGSVLLLLGILALYFIYPAIAAQHPEIAAQFGTAPTFNVLAFHAMAPYLAVQLPVLDVPGILRRICDQGSDVPVPHLAARCARRSAHGRFGHSGRRSAEDGNVRISAIQPADSAGRHEALCSDDDRAVDHRHRLRRAGRHDAAGHEEARGVLVGQPHGFRDAGHVCAESERTERQHSCSRSITEFRPERSS